ncbi:MAG: protein-tyrosine phosphatase [Tepidanaerobacteraceae bacterium]|nr:protein-tyrosine phosphatase [Tepidanaerobacteraceae bacterium]MDN5301111.1 protein-tyrosine phosphatase [Thermoanaerobacteraceae bacterium]
MIDIHTHILPGIDDGSPDLETSIKMAEIAASEGIDIMVATPHFIPKDKEIERDRVLKKTEELNEYIKNKAGLDIAVYPGEEVFLSPEVPDLFSQGKLITLFDGGKYLLVELPMMSIPPYTKDVLHALMLKGAKPIIAHPERNREIARDLDRLKELVSLGALVQVNSLSFYGVFGRDAKHTAQRIVAEGMAQFMATDCHTARARSPRYLKTLQMLPQSKINLLMQENPEKVMTGRDIEASSERDKKSGKMNLFQKLTFFLGQL